MKFGPWDEKLIRLKDVPLSHGRTVAPAQPTLPCLACGKRLLIEETSRGWKSALHLKMLDVRSVNEWRAWLNINHLTCEGVWLVFHRKTEGGPSITYDEAIDEALAYGWIDSIIKKIDNQRYARKFTPRRPRSIWSRSNTERVNRLSREGRMTEMGLEAFEKRTSEISLLEKFKSEPIRVPEDLLEALKKNKEAQANFERFTPSYRKRYVMWISAAKRPETRRKRVDEAVLLISRNVKALLK
jgi:uncharacterized protein YdeI (YjbR/CyaY-like superfamily)